MTTNGHDKDEEKIVRFPDKAGRKRAEKEKAAQEKAWRKQYKQEQKAKEPPFLNLEKISPFIGGLVVAFVIVHLPLYLLFDASERFMAFTTLGFVPGAFTGHFDFHWYTPLTALTHMFIHGSWMHLIFNGVMTLALGLFVERELGTRTAAIFFFACGLAGAAAYFILAPFSTVPIIGASGGTSGLFGAVLLLIYDRKNQLGTVTVKMGGRGPLSKGPWPMIGFWILFMLIIGLLSGGTHAWQAHIGGFIAGVALLRALQKGIVRF